MNSRSSNDRRALRRLDWLEPFEPNRVWRGGWLQTASVKAVRPDLAVDQWPAAQRIDVPDDQTPPDVMSGRFLPARRLPGRDPKPTVVVLHGMGGHAKSGYMRSLAERLLENGHSVILWNNRGAGGTARSCRRFHHPGLSDDIRRLLDRLHNRHAEWIEHGLVAAAFSLGANVLLNYLAESADQSAFSAAVSVSAPLNMEITSRNLRTGLNRIFDRYLLKRQQEELLRPNAELTDSERNAIRNASSVWELDDRFTAPRFGHACAADFYQAHSAVYALDSIQTRTLLIHAEDDPVVDDDVFRKRDFSEGALYPALLRSGGHMGFLDRRGRRWHEQAAVKFFEQMA